MNKIVKKRKCFQETKLCFPCFILFLILITAAKGGSSLVSLITPGDSDFIIDLVVINIVSEDFNI